MIARFFSPLRLLVRDRSLATYVVLGGKIAHPREIEMPFLLLKPEARKETDATLPNTRMHADCPN